MKINKILLIMALPALLLAAGCNIEVPEHQESGLEQSIDPTSGASGLDVPITPIKYPKVKSATTQNAEASTTDSLSTKDICGDNSYPWCVLWKTFIK